MTTLKWLASAGLALGMFPALYADAHCPGNLASIRPRIIGRSVMVIPVTVNNSGPYDFVVDTGAQITTIDSSLASALNPTPLGATHVTGIGVYSHAEYGQLEVLQAGTYSIKKPLILIQDLGQLQKSDAHIRGILGENFLEHFDLFIDYAHGILCLDDSKQMQERVKGQHIALALLPHQERSLPFTQPMIIEVQAPGIADQPLLLQLDSGVQVPFLFKVGKGLPHLSYVASSQRHRDSDEVIQAFAVLPPQDIQIGGHLFRKIPFMTPVDGGKDIPVKPEVDGVVPTGLFARVFISYADHFAVLDPW